MSATHLSGPLIVDGGVYGVVPFGAGGGNAWFVSTAGGDAGGKDWESAYNAIQDAHDAAVAGDTIYVAPGEYNEDVVISKAQVSLIGVGPRHSIRVTGIATGSGGTATGLTVSGVNEVGVYNINSEGRTGGSGIQLTGQIRRFHSVGCKFHGGDQAFLINVPGGAQTVDIIVDDPIIANSAIGINVLYAGGDPCHQLRFKNPYFSKITTDCVLQNGATHDWCLDRPLFGLSDGTEPTRFIDLDDAGTTGQIFDPRFCTTLFAASKIAIATGMMIIGWRTEREVEATDGGTNGRPD